MTNLVYRCGYDTPSKVEFASSLNRQTAQGHCYHLLNRQKAELHVLCATLQKYHALARVFGSAGGLFGREDEQQVFSAVADAGLGPKVLVCCSCTLILVLICAERSI